MQLGQSLMADRIRERDWSSSPLGPREQWPLELTTALGLILESAFPQYLVWGDELLSFFNDAYMGVLGKKPDALGRSFAEVWPEVWDELAPIVHDAMAGQATFQENRLLILDRGAGLEETWWTFSYSPVRGAGDRICGVLCTVWETTRLILAERQAVQQADEFRRFSALVPELLWVTRTPHEVNWANQRMIEFLGVDPTTIGVDWPSLVHPDDVEPIRLRFEKALATRTMMESRHRLRRADGGFRWVLVRSQPVIGPDDEIEGWYSAATDIHDWHIAAESMHFKEELFDTFARSSRKVLWIVDVASQRIEYLGGDSAHIWGEQSAPQIRSRGDWLRSVHPEDRDRQQDFLPRLQNGELIQEEYRVIGHEGHIRKVRETLFPVPDSDGAIRRAGGIAEAVDPPELPHVYLVVTEPAAARSLASHFWRRGFKPRTFAGVDEFLKIAPALQSGCVLLRDPGGAGSVGRVLGAFGLRRHAFPTIVLTPRHSDAEEVRVLMKMGAFDVLPVGGESEERLLNIVREALHNVDPVQAEPPARSARERLVALSPREREVLDRLVAGLSSKLIAKELMLSPRTIEVHRANIKDKLHVATISEAMALAAAAKASAAMSTSMVNRR